MLRRWPGALIEFYGMTEGGGSCILEAHRHPDKLHTVGTPAPGHDIRLIDEAGREVARGEAGEVVGHSPGMMTSYHRRPEATRARAEWFDAGGKRFIRTGDIGRFDEDGFPDAARPAQGRHHLGRLQHLPERPRGRAARAPGTGRCGRRRRALAPMGRDAGGLRRAPRRAPDTRRRGAAAVANARLGKTQRLASLHSIEALPRSPIGKVLKRDLRELHGPV